MKRISVTLLGIIISLTFAWSQNQTYDLKALLNHALENSYAKLDAQLENQKAKYKTKEAISSGLPQVSAFGQFDDNLKLATVYLPGELAQMPGMDIPVQFGKKYNATAAVEFSQLIYSQQFIYSIKAAKSTEELYQLKEVKTEEDIIYNVSAAYYNLSTIQKQLEVLNANIHRLEELQKTTSSLYKADMALKTDVNRIKVNLVNLETEKEKLLNAIDQLKNYLTYLAGFESKEDIQIDTYQLSEEYRLPDWNQNPNISNRIEMQLLNQQNELFSIQEKTIKAGYLPTLAAYGRYAWQGQNNEFNYFNGTQEWNDYSLVGLKLNIPIFDGLNKHSKIKQAKIQQEQTSLKIQETKNLIDIELENASKTFASNYKSYKAQQENKDLAKEVYSQTNLKYKEGLAPLTDLLNAETVVREAENNFYQAFLNCKIAELNLYKANSELKKLIQ